MARTFNATTSLVTGPSVTFGSNLVTVVATINPSGDGEGGDFWAIAIHGGQTTTGAGRNRRWGFYMRTIAAVRHLYFSVGALTTAGDWASAAITLPNSSTHQVGVTWDGSNVANDPIFYLDGVAVAGALIADTNPVGALTAEPQILYAGATSAGDATANGKIQGLARWSRVLSATEMALVYAQGVFAVHTAGLGPYWKMPAADTSTLVIDYAWTGVDGTAANATASDDLTEPLVIVPAVVTPLPVVSRTIPTVWEPVWLAKVGSYYVADRDYEGEEA